MRVLRHDKDIAQRHHRFAEMQRDITFGLLQFHFFMAA